MIDLQQLGTQTKTSGVNMTDTDELRFEQDVLLASMSKPVIVFFWAAGSVVCKQVQAILEKVAGAIPVVRVNATTSAELTHALRIQSVPTLYAFFQGRPVDGLAGSKSEAELQAFVDKLKKLSSAIPSEETDKAAVVEQIKKFMGEGDQFFQQGSFEEAMARYGGILELDGDNKEALGGIGWCLLSLGDAASVREMLGQLPPEQLKSPRLQGLQFILSFEKRAEGLEGAAALAEKLLKNPKDLQGHYDLALQYFAAGQLEKGIDALVALIRLNREWQEQKARKLLLDIFEALGNAHPLTLPGRRKLSAVLFS
jgi:putative thioredoxin